MRPKRGIASTADSAPTAANASARSVTPSSTSERHRRPRPRRAGEHDEHREIVHRERRLARPRTTAPAAARGCAASSAITTGRRGHSSDGRMRSGASRVSRARARVPLGRGRSCRTTTRAAAPRARRRRSSRRRRTSSAPVRSRRLIRPAAAPASTDAHGPARAAGDSDDNPAQTGPSAVNAAPPGARAPDRRQLGGHPPTVASIALARADAARTARGGHLRRDPRATSSADAAGSSSGTTTPGPASREHREEQRPPLAEARRWHAQQRPARRATAAAATGSRRASAPTAPTSSPPRARPAA